MHPISRLEDECANLVLWPFGCSVWAACNGGGFFGSLRSRWIESLWKSEKSSLEAPRWPQSLSEWDFADYFAGRHAE